MDASLQLAIYGCKAASIHCSCFAHQSSPVSDSPTISLMDNGGGTGESDNPQGVVNTGEGRVVRAFHRFTLVDQSQRGLGDLTKGRRRDQGAVKISCARQDPNARNCHGYRKFVKRSVLEHGQNGYIQNDTIVIRYTIELVVSTGGALSRTMAGPPPRPTLIQVMHRVHLYALGPTALTSGHLRALAI